MTAPEPARRQADDGRRLAPVLGLFSALALVVGDVIGSGIFLKPSEIAAATGGHLGLILSLWIGCGMVNLCGALTLAELSAMLPQAGGTYVFLREAYGRIWAFAWTWAEVWVIRSGAIAALAAAMALLLSQLLNLMGQNARPGGEHFETLVALAAIGSLAVVNAIGTRWGSTVQNVTTVIKAGFLIFLGLLPFLAARGETFQLESLWPESPDRQLLLGLGTALAGIMWAYDGWGQVTVVAEEIRNPKRNVPIALGGGVVILIVLYTGANLAYHLTLPSAEIAASQAVAVDVTRALSGDFGARLMTAGVLISVFGALNSNILMGPRVLFAVARDHSRLRVLRHIDPRFGTPALAILVLSIWSMALIALADVQRYFWSSGSEKRLFDVLTEYTIFGGSIFYLLAVAAVFVLRAKYPRAERPYRTWGYPVVPAVFVGAYALLLVSMFVAAPMECSAGLILIVAGFGAYQLIEREGTPPRSQPPPG